MSGRDIFSFVFTFEDLDRELTSRGAQIPFNKMFKFSDTAGIPVRNRIFR